MPQTAPPTALPAEAAAEDTRADARTDAPPLGREGHGGVVARSASRPPPARTLGSPLRTEPSAGASPASPVTATAPRCRRAAFTLPRADAPRPAPQARMCLGPPHPRVRCGCAVSSQVRCSERARPPRDSWGLRSPHPVPEPRRSRASGSLRSGLRGADSPCTALGPAAAGFLTLFNQRKQRRFSPEHRA